MNELEMFRRGMDTYDIAQELRQSEALTYNRLEQLRRAERLEAQSANLPRHRVRYAGQEPR